jgi:predicted MFS family arabinose efflux permease
VEGIFKPLCASGFIVFAIMRVMDPLLPTIARDFGVSVGSVAIVVTAYTAAYGLFQLIYGPLGDRIGKLKVITVAMAITALGCVACTFAPGLPLLAACRFLTGTTAAAVVPLSLAFIGDNVSYQDRQATIGRFLGALMLGQILGGSLAGVFADYLGWRGIFMVFGALSLLIAVQLARSARIVVEPASNHAPGGVAALRPYAELIREPSPRLLIATVFVEGFFFYGGFAFIGAFLKVRFGLSYLAIGLILANFGIGGLIYSRSVRHLLRRLGERGMILGGGLVCGGCYLALTIAPQWQWFIPILMLAGLSFYMLHNTLQTLATELAPAARGTAVSLFAFSLFLGQGVGAALLGAVVDGWGYAVAFAIAGTAMALLALWFQGQLLAVLQEARIDA